MNHIKTLSQLFGTDAGEVLLEGTVGMLKSAQNEGFTSNRPVLVLPGFLQPLRFVCAFPP